MRRFISILSLLLCVCCMAQAKDRVIERPPFLAWSSSSIEVDKIVMSDTVTTVYIKAYYRPKNWIKIATGSFLKDNNGTLYPIRKGVGITLDKEFWMPESGEAEFQLLFPPIPEGVTSLDFSEGDFENAFKIWGIQLDKKGFSRFKLPKEVTVAKANPKMMLPDPIVRNGKAVLKGFILDYQKGMPDQGRVYTQDIITGPYQQTEIKINDDGSFFTEVDVTTVTPCSLMLPFGKADCLLVPGETTDVVINAREGARMQSHLRKTDKPYGKPAYYSGFLAGLQQELADNRLSFNFGGDSYEESIQQMKRICGKTPEEYKNYIFAKLTAFRKQIIQSKCSPAYKEILNIELDLSAIRMLIETDRNLKSAYITANNLEGEKARDYFMKTKVEIPDDYYKCLQEFKAIASPKACYSHRYAEFIRMLQRSDIARMIQSNVAEVNSDYMNKNLKTFLIGASIKDFNPLTDEQKGQLTSLPAAYGERLLAMNDELLKKIEINKKKTGFTVNEAGQVANEELFASIISKFRGHTLLVDFWATWCGPCRMANKAMNPMKEELKDKDIIYLYITGETSPLGTWNNMIPDIHGEHFRVTNDQWSYLMSNFNIQGVPTYFVIDPEGNITFKQTGFPGVDAMKKQLLKVTDK